MPLILEVLVREIWMKLDNILPGHPGGSLSNNLPDGMGRDIYHFACSDDGKHSVVRRSHGGFDVEHTQTVREIVPIFGWDNVATLTDGQSFEIEVKTDRGDHLHLRLTHLWPHEPC